MDDDDRPQIHYRGVNNHWQQIVGSSRLISADRLVDDFAIDGWPALAVRDDHGTLVGEIVTTDLGQIEWTRDGYCGPTYPRRQPRL